MPISHLGDMRTLFEGLPLVEMNTSMTINATAAWLLSLYVALARSRAPRSTSFRARRQNDIVKEYLSRGTYIFPPKPSLKLITDTVTWSTRELEVEPDERVLLPSCWRPARSRYRSSLSRSPPPSPSLMPCAIPVKCRRRSFPKWSAASASS